MKKVLFSASTPSGSLTIGNYLGAISQWITDQNQYDCLFSIVDLHAISVPRDPEVLQALTVEALALYIACGLDPELSTIFIQSHNPAHAELCWMLGGVTAFGDLSRMTQFKEKSGRQQTVTAGLFNYPILMAADILLYRTDLVPVGDDQQQHIELARGIARRFNSTYGEVFAVPRGKLSTVGARIRNLSDPTRKMDKSEPNRKGVIGLLDAPDQVVKKIARARTDSVGSFDISDPDQGISNLVTMFAAITKAEKLDVVEQYRTKGYGSFKRDLANVVVELLLPLQDRYREIASDRQSLAQVIARGAERARMRSLPTMQAARKACGLISEAPDVT